LGGIYKQEDIEADAVLIMGFICFFDSHEEPWAVITHAGIFAGTVG